MADNLHPDKNSKLVCICGWDKFNMVEKKRKGRAGLSSTYRNDTGANAELTMG